MIQPEELRLGNYVLSKETQQPQRITGITTENPFIDAITFDYTDYEDIDPIPVTEEILLKCGFEKKDAFWFTKDIIKIETTLSRGRFKYAGFVSVKHLHQLQNLYFALTGQELEINL